MVKSTTYQLRPSRPFTAHYPLTISDSFMIQIDNPYLYLFSTSQLLRRDERTHLINILKDSLATFFQQPLRSPYNLPELLGKIYEDPTTSNLIVNVTPSSSVLFVVNDRSDILFTELKPDASFPVQPLTPSIFGPSITSPPPNAKKGVPAFWVQLTFLNGGFAIHVHIHHWIAGVSGAGRLVEAWFERARLLAQTVDTDIHRMDDVVSNSTIQLGGREALTEALNTVTVPQLKHPEFLHKPGGRRIWAGLDLHPLLLWVLVKTFLFLFMYFPFIMPQSEVQIFHFKPEALRRLRNDAHAEAASSLQGKGNELTANDCLTALIWSCITRARYGSDFRDVRKENDDGNTSASPSTSTIMVVVDYKSRLNPQLHPNFFGNANVDVHVALPISTLTSVSNSPSNSTTESSSSAAASSSSASSSSSSSSSSLYAAAQKIHHAVSSITDAHIRSIYQLIASRPRIPDTQQRPLHFQYGSDLISTSWEHVHQDPQLLQLDILSDSVTGKGTRIVFEKMRPMQNEGADGLCIVSPAYGRKWKEWKSNEGDGAAAQQNGLEVIIGLTRKSMTRLKTDEVFLCYAEWVEDGGY